MSGRRLSLQRRLRTCAECGHIARTMAEYHPYAFCVLVKAGLDPVATVREAAEKMGLAPKPKEQEPVEGA